MASDSLPGKEEVDNPTGGKQLSLSPRGAGELTILTPSLALHLVHVCWMASLRALGINIHISEMPAKVEMQGGLFWPPRILLEHSLSPSWCTGGTIRCNCRLAVRGGAC